jgi:hypothetical protein
VFRGASSYISSLSTASTDTWGKSLRDRVRDSRLRAEKPGTRGFPGQQAARCPGFGTCESSRDDVQWVARTELGSPPRNSKEWVVKIMDKGDVEEGTSETSPPRGWP